MSPGWRAFYGAACGALAVLLIHPASRPFLLLPLTHWGESETFAHTPLILDNQKQLRPPRTLMDASLLMENGARTVAIRRGLQPVDIQKLVVVARNAALTDTDNAYWPQMEAVFLNVGSKLAGISEAVHVRYRKDAVDAWLRASKLSRWNDSQSKRLKMLQEQLAAEVGAPMAWQYSAAYRQRSTQQAFMIEETARDFVRSADSGSADALKIRYATLINGKLLREGAKSIEVGKIGADVVESAAYSKDVNPKFQRKSEGWRRRNTLNIFEAQLHKRGQIDAQINSEKIFRGNEAWLALTGVQQIDEQTNELSWLALFTATVPGAMIAVAAFGGLLWMVSFAFKCKPVLLKVVEAPIAPAIGLVLAVLLYYETELYLAAIAVVACFSFLAFTPPNERTNPPDQLGTAFEITIFVLSALLAVFGIAFIIGVSTPGIQILPDLNVPKEFYGGSTLFMGLVAIMLGLLTLAAPAWAMSKKLATPFVIMLTTRQFGRGLFLGALALVIIVTPLAVIADRALFSQLEETILNEPLHYLSK